MKKKKKTDTEIICEERGGECVGQITQHYFFFFYIQVQISARLTLPFILLGSINKISQVIDSLFPQNLKPYANSRNNYYYAANRPKRLGRRAEMPRCAYSDFPPSQLKHCRDHFVSLHPYEFDKIKYHSSTGVNNCILTLTSYSN